MKSFIKQACIIFSVVFTALILIQFFRGMVLDNKVVSSFIVVSLFSGVMSFLAMDNEKLSDRWVVILQIIYIAAIMTATIVLSYYGGWEISIGSMTVNFIIVMGIFTLLKFFLFKEDEKEAEEMNTALENRRNSENFE